jgi:hypothetical protein
MPSIAVVAAVGDMETADQDGTEVRICGPTYIVFEPGVGT